MTQKPTTKVNACNKTTLLPNHLWLPTVLVDSTGINDTRMKLNTFHGPIMIAFFIAPSTGLVSHGTSW